VPYPNEHACRLRDPADFAPGTFRSMSRQHTGRRYRVILGKLRGKSGARDPMVEQTYRYPSDTWTAREAMAHCRGHGGLLFEAATEPALRRDPVSARSTSP
jgi:hypothetical protein